MTLSEATTGMLLGKLAIRIGWAGYFLTILPNQNYIWSVGRGSSTPQVNAVIYIPSAEDILATDWIFKN